MASNDYILSGDAVEGSETTIEIKIKTLDSQTYTLRVDKQMPVPALKEQIASVTGVLSEQQRLICRGKVLKDDQLLSAYHVEDGHTLHMVVRQPVPAAFFEGLNLPATDAASSTSRGHINQVAPGVVIETVGLPGQVDGAPPEINRIISAVLGSIGILNSGSGSEGTDREHGAQRVESTSSASSLLDSLRVLPEHPSTRVPIDRLHGTFGNSVPLPSGSLPPNVIPDSLTTLSQYLSSLRREFDAIVRNGGSSGQEGALHRAEERSSQSASGTRHEGLPTPAALAEVTLSTRQMLVEQAAESLMQLVIQLENQANVTDPLLRSNTQSSVSRTGALFHNLGGFLLELGRTIMTLRLGQAPAEAVVNAGPAVFISPNGPNPIMVQPLPFQVGASFGAIPMGAVQPGSGLANGVGTGFIPRRIEIQIRRGSATATPNVNREEPNNNQQPSVQRNPATSSDGENPNNQTNSRVSDGPAFAGERAVRVVPLRTMVTAVPSSFGRPDMSGNSTGLYYPVYGRFQQVASGHMSVERRTQVAGERQPPSLHSEQFSEPQQRQRGDPARDGLSETPNVRQQEPVARSVSINILSAGGMQNNLESERQVPGSVLNLLRTLFPGGEIHVDDGSSEGTAADSIPEQARTSSGVAGAPETEPRPSDEGIFLSNLLHQIIPVVSQQAGSESDAVPPEQANAFQRMMAQGPSTQAGTSRQDENSSAGTSRRPTDEESSSPSAKRQKME
ncbi:hypothetical protein UlMin_002917 [Ulmus minor]